MGECETIGGGGHLLLRFRPGEEFLRGSSSACSAYFPGDTGEVREPSCTAVSCEEAKYKGDGGIEWRVAGWEKVAVPVRTRGHEEWAIEKKAHGHAHDTSREGGVTEAQGRQGRNEPQVPESESSPRAEP